jgi:hypothetical protein
MLTKCDYVTGEWGGDGKLLNECSTVQYGVEYQGKMTWWDTYDILVLRMGNVTIVSTNSLLV